MGFDLIMKLRRTKPGARRDKWVEATGSFFASYRHSPVHLRALSKGALGLAEWEGHGAHLMGRRLPPLVLVAPSSRSLSWARNLRRALVLGIRAHVGLARGLVLHARIHLSRGQKSRRVAGQAWILQRRCLGGLGVGGRRQMVGRGSRHLREALLLRCLVLPLLHARHDRRVRQGGHWRLHILEVQRGTLGCDGVLPVRYMRPL